MTVAYQRFGRFRLLYVLQAAPEVEIWLAAPADARSDYPSEMEIYRWPSSERGKELARTYAELLRSASGPSIAPFIEAHDEDAGVPYVACGYLQSISLARLLAVSPLTPRVAVAVTGDVLRALGRLHHAGFACGRVSLESVHITTAGDVQLCGLHAATRLLPHRAGTGATIPPSSHSGAGAALRALAPEVARGESPSERSDIYSAGVLLLELLLGEAWAQGADLDVLARAQSGDAARTNLSALGISDGLRDELLRALQPSPFLRHMDAVDFADNLFAYGTSDAQSTLAELARTVLLGRVPTRPEGLTAPPSSPDLEANLDDQTSRFHVSPSFVTTRRGERVGPLSYAQLVEKTVGGAFASDDMVELMGSPAIMLSHVEELIRLLPAARVPTKRPQGFTPEQSALALLAELSALYTEKRTAVLSIQRAKGTTSDVRHLHVKEGIVTSVDTREPSDLLGEYLVQSGQLPRSIVDEALAALPRYRGQLGQALIGEGAASSLFVFRAIVMHLTKRFVSSSAWEDVFVAVENTTAVRPVLFPVRLCVPQLMYEWLEAFELTQALTIAPPPQAAHELGPLAEDAALAHDLAHPVAALASVLRRRMRWSEALPAVRALGFSEPQAVHAWHVLSLL